MKLFYAYILKSKKDGTYYYGSSQNIDTRIKIHNLGKEKYTKGHLPYKLHFYETFSTRAGAYAREKYFKSIEGYRWLKSKNII